jgi:hypothetical protein
MNLSRSLGRFHYTPAQVLGTLGSHLRILNRSADIKLVRPSHNTTLIKSDMSFVYPSLDSIQRLHIMSELVVVGHPGIDHDDTR